MKCILVKKEFYAGIVKTSTRQKKISLSQFDLWKGEKMNNRFTRSLMTSPHAPYRQLLTSMNVGIYKIFFSLWKDT
jgi:hypothetical protein